MLSGLLCGLLLLGIPAAWGWAQASHLTAPTDDYLLRTTQAWGRESALGDLTMIPIAPGDVELRFWQGYGLSGEWGIILRRRQDHWVGWRAAIQRCRILIPVPVGDTLSPAGREVYRRKARASCGAQGRDTLRGGWVIAADTVALHPLSAGAEYQRFWDVLKSAGILELPPHIPRSWAMRDGHTYVVEVRRGGDYRASVIEHAARPEARGDSLVQRLAPMIDEWARAQETNRSQ